MKDCREVLIDDLLNKNCSELISNCDKLYDNINNNSLTTKLFKENDGKIPFVAKDNFLIKGKKITAGSRILQNFICPYTATVVERLLKVFSLVGIAKMEEFALGSTGQYTLDGVPVSPWKGYCCGGSSSGSAVAVASGIAMMALGTDTGGSVRLPAAYCGIVGFKPTYGIYSRYGIVPLSDRLDHPAIFTKTVKEVKFVHNLLVGKDENDFTTVDYCAAAHTKKVVGYFKEFGTSETFEKVKKFLQDKGYTFKEYSLPILKDVVSIYCVVNMCELSSNLSRYSGVFYGDDDIKSVDDIFYGTRNRLLGPEPKRRIVIGNNIMQESCMEDYLGRASRLQQDLYDDMSNIYKEVDVVMTPIMQAVKNEDLDKLSPSDIYLLDMQLCLANLIGIPAITVPIEVKNAAPSCIQLMSKEFGDDILFELGSMLDENYKFYKNLKDL
jgi:aspartyl-tRNA(Asn)/glutamyl-tRNA(Gln) amidotransferase subunit A